MTQPISVQNIYVPISAAVGVDARVRDRLVAASEPYKLVHSLDSGGRERWAVDVNFIPSGSGWKAIGPTGWLNPSEAEIIGIWCKKNAASEWDILGGQTLFESYDDATLFYISFVQ